MSRIGEDLNYMAIKRREWNSNFEWIQLLKIRAEKAKTKQFRLKEALITYQQCYQGC
jgi:hypothetical protein